MTLWLAARLRFSLSEQPTLVLSPGRLQVQFLTLQRVLDVHQALPLQSIDQGGR